jgi:transcription initiation factor TFIIIB Brf1 subunit/transcription initiation factor TFIIB
MEQTIQLSSKSRRAWKLYDNRLTKMNQPISIETSQLQDLCSHCGYSLAIVDDGFPTCSNPSCGAVISTVLDYSPEWSSFGREDKTGNDMTRCGNPANPLLKESSAACKVMRTPRCSYEMRKIDKSIEWMSMPHKEKTLWDEFQYITNIGRIAGITQKIIDDALIRHKEISEQQMFRGVNRDSIKAASIYIAYRQNGYPRTALEIANMFHLDKRNATKGCALAVSIINNIERNSDSQTDLCRITPALIVERYCSYFSIPEHLILLAKFMAHKIDELGLIRDNTPQAIASGIVYYICQRFNCGGTKADIIAKCQISDVTIAKCFKKMEAYESKIVPPSLLSNT